MKKPKEGDKVRLVGTFINAIVVNNHANGYYDIQFEIGGSPIIRKDVHISELCEPLGVIAKQQYSKFMKFRVFMNQLPVLFDKTFKFIINLCKLLILLFCAMGIGLVVFAIFKIMFLK